MLSPELDALRDKTLRFGCLLLDLNWYDNDIVLCMYITDRNVDDRKNEVMYQYLTDEWIVVYGTWSPNTILWHPLTWWRLTYYHELHSDRGDIDDARSRIDNIFFKNIELYAQDETQRMKHEQRPELFELLKEFSDLLPKKD